jgi:hypothetical protein
MLVLTTGCAKVDFGDLSGQDASTDADTDIDTDVDTDTDAGTDAGTDTDTDTDTDTNTDIDTDTDTDTGTDTDTDFDAGHDSGADAASDTDTDTDADSCATAISYIANHPYDFEGCSDDGWTLQTDAEWETGDPSDVVAAYEGGCVIATDLNGNYGNSVSGNASSPTIDLSACDDSDTITLKFAMAYDIESSSTCGYDYAYVQVNNGSSWVTVTPAPGYDYGTKWCGEHSTLSWTNYSVDVSSQARGNSSFRVRFHFQADIVYNYYGMYVDMVELEHSE